MLEFLRKQLAELMEKRKAAVEKRDASIAAAQTESRTELTEDEKTALEAGVAEVRKLDDEIKPLQERIAEAEETEARAAKVAEDQKKWRSQQVKTDVDPNAALNNMPTGREARAGVILKSIEKRMIGDKDAQAHTERILLRHANDEAWAKNLLARSTPAYESAFAKLMTGREMTLTNEERAAIAVGTNTQGGYLVPTHLDPTLILTNAGSANAIRPISRQTTLTTGNVWHGVTTAGVTASFDAELAEVSDDTPGFASASVTLFSARAFVQASYEAFEDTGNNLAGDVVMLIADARDRLEGAMHATGSGTGQPRGIFTAINATTNQQVVSTTAAAIGLVDLQATYLKVGQRWRNSGQWVMHPTYLTAVQALGTALSASYTTNLTEPLTDRLIGRPVTVTDDAPSAQTTTVKDQEILFGDFSNFLIVDKPGSTSLEFIPNLFNTNANLPDGRRGWFAFWRTGSDCLNAAAFALLVDKTSA